MRTAQHSRDQVNVAFGQQLAAFRQPQQRPVHGFCIAVKVTDKRFFRQRWQAVYRFAQVVVQTIGVAPGLCGIVNVVCKGDFHARTQHRFGFQQVRQARNRKTRAVEEAFVRPEVDAGAGVAFAARADNLQILHLIAVFKGDVIDLAVATNVHFHAFGQGVHHGNAHAVQTTGELIVFVGELTARMQTAEDQLDGRHALFRMDIHRHAAPVVDNFQRLIGVQDNVNALGMACQRFVHTVINNFLAQVVWARRIGVHPRAAANRLKPGEDLNGISVIGLRHDLS